VDDLAVTEHTHRDHDEADAIGQFRNIEGVACHARVHVGTHQAQQQAQHDHGDGLEQRARGQHHGADQAQHHQREVLGRAEFEGHLGQRRGKGGQDQCAHAAGEEGSHAGRRQRGPRPPLARHLVAVDHGHHRGRLARQVDQDGRGGAAVLGTVVDAGQHDQRGNGRQRVGGRQQHGDGGNRTNARQHADQRAQQHADEGVHQVLEGEGDAEAEREIRKKIHVLALLNPR
jgi:hypothetical protein